jgi:L-lactate dehydrogenase complex protein LldF
VIVKEGYSPAAKKIAMQGMSTTLSSPTAYRIAGKAGRLVIKYMPFAVNNKLNPWYKHRDMPSAPKQSFREWYTDNRKK